MSEPVILQRCGFDTSYKQVTKCVYYDSEWVPHREHDLLAQDLNPTSIEEILERPIAIKLRRLEMNHSCLHNLGIDILVSSKLDITQVGFVSVQTLKKKSQINRAWDSKNRDESDCNKYLIRHYLPTTLVESVDFRIRYL